MIKSIVTKIIKRCTIGGIIVIVSDFVCDVGKGYMLGTMLRHDTDAKETYDILSMDAPELNVIKRNKLKIVRNVAHWKSKKD